MKESTVLFGDRKSLVGIITEPGLVEGPTNPTAVLLLNAGLVHRVGPARLYTRMARSLAEAGFTVLRFDFSGIGDSEVRKDQLSSEESAIHEAREAMDLMNTTRKVSKFVLAGICSGAHNSLPIALADPRVAGTLLIESYGYSTTGYIVTTYVRRLFRWRMWWKLLTGQLRPWNWLQSTVSAVSSRVSQRLNEENPAWQPPPTEKIISDLRTLGQRGVRLCFIYDSLGPSYYYYRSTLRRDVEASCDPTKIQVVAIVGTDHTFTPLFQQERLIKTVCEWAQENFGAGNGVPRRGVDAQESVLPP
ncbi:MAG: alpha/beta hydrolase [Acidobacteriia bacterium]|nr:alpha/beta hydrolase [Terriglobia bacterium]